MLTLFAPVNVMAEFPESRRVSISAERRSALEPATNDIDVRELSSATAAVSFLKVLLLRYISKLSFTAETPVKVLI